MSWSSAGAWTAAARLAARLCLLQRAGLRPHPLAAVWRANPAGSANHRQRSGRHSLLFLRLHHWSYIPPPDGTHGHLHRLLYVCHLQPLRGVAGHLPAGDARENAGRNRKVLRSKEEFRCGNVAHQGPAFLNLITLCIGSPLQLNPANV